MAVQTTMYVIFVGLFQCMVLCMRVKEEYFLDKHVMDRIVENHFDSSHNTFESVRRVADIWEWGNTVLWPGLFGDLGPCQDYVGNPSVTKSCVDDAWPDGEGSFHMEGNTPYDVHELVMQMDKFDWSEGIIFRQVRALRGECPGQDQLGDCYPPLPGNGIGNTTSYGYNFTHPDEPLAHPFTHFDYTELGSDPSGMVSAAIPSMRVHATSGFVAFVVPFFSDTYLPYEEGGVDEVTDYRRHYVNGTNGRAARFYCVRTSTNALFIKQRCDPGSNGDGTGRLTGAVRRHVEVFWNDLKRAHWIDPHTRVVALFLHLKSNHVGVRMRYTLMFELTALGAILPSYDVESRIMEKDMGNDMYMLSTIALGLVVLFCLLEFVEAYYEGLSNYLTDVWNIMDWANFLIYFMVYERIMALIAALDVDQRDCSSYLCRDVGIFDDWLAMGTYRDCKLFLSFCVCIQLFKILKFASQLVPKTGLATAVLRKAAVDMIFFLFTFVISMLAFSMMLYLQLGPVMQGYMGQEDAFITLFRGLFGDFDIDDIMDNSSGYLNALLFLSYLFVAIFIMLSMFLAILAEKQVDVRTDESNQKEDPEFEKQGGEYGVITQLGRLGRRMCRGEAQPRSAPVAEVASVSAAADGAAASDAVAAAPTPLTVCPVPVRAATEDSAAVLAAIAGLTAEIEKLRVELHGQKAAALATSPHGVKLDVPGGLSRSPSSRVRSIEM